MATPTKASVALAASLASLKALSIKQPFVGMILSGQKTREYRSWKTAYRGVLLIHAGSNEAPGVSYEAMDEHLLERGCLLGSVELVDCQWCDQYGCYAWLLEDPRPLQKSVPMPGKLGLWKPPEDVIRMILPELMA